jgi:hypothetical protein
LTPSRTSSPSPSKTRHLQSPLPSSSSSSSSSGSSTVLFVQELEQSLLETLHAILSHLRQRLLYNQHEQYEERLQRNLSIVKSTRFEDINRLLRLQTAQRMDSQTIQQNQSNEEEGNQRYKLGDRIFYLSTSLSTPSATSFTASLSLSLSSFSLEHHHHHLCLFEGHIVAIDAYSRIFDVKLITPHFGLIDRVHESQVVYDFPPVCPFRARNDVNIRDLHAISSSPTSSLTLGTGHFHRVLQTLVATATLLYRSILRLTASPSSVSSSVSSSSSASASAVMVPTNQSQQQQIEEKIWLLLDLQEFVAEVVYVLLSTMDRISFAPLPVHSIPAMILQVQDTVRLFQDAVDFSSITLSSSTSVRASRQQSHSHGHSHGHSHVHVQIDSSSNNYSNANGTADPTAAISAEQSTSSFDRRGIMLRSRNSSSRSSVGTLSRDTSDVNLTSRERERGLSHGSANSFSLLTTRLSPDRWRSFIHNIDEWSVEIVYRLTSFQQKHSISTVIQSPPMKPPSTSLQHNKERYENIA